MNFSAKLAQSIAIAGAAVVVIMGQPASAQLTWADIEAQQQRLGHRITDLLSKTRISAAQAAKLRADLDNIAAREVKFRSDPGGGRAERASLARELDALSVNIEAAAARSSTGSTAGSVDSSGLATRKADLEKRIADGVASGKLGRGEARDLRDDLDYVAGREASARRSGQRLTAAEVRRLNESLDRVDGRLKAVLRDQVDFGERTDNPQRRILARIKDGTASHQLTAKEAARLQAEFDRIAQLEATYRSSAGAIDFNEWNTLKGDLQNLNRQVTAELEDANAPYCKLHGKHHRHDHDDDD